MKILSPINSHNHTTIKPQKPQMSKEAKIIHIDAYHNESNLDSKIEKTNPSETLWTNVKRDMEMILSSIEINLSTK